MSLYEGAVKRPIMTFLCFIAIVIFGLFSLSRLPVDLYPDIETNTIMVMTAYPGASASDIENNVSRPLESVLNTIGNLKHITSRSSENMSLIQMQFEYGHDINELTNDVRDKLDMISSSLPDNAETPVIFKFSSDMIPILILSVQAEESQPALHKILDDGVSNPLARIPGVGTVSVAGAPKREIQVYCDPNKLEAYHLTIETISAAIGAENRSIPGGSFDIGNETYALRVEGEFKDASQIENIVVGSRNGANVYLRDVARVIDTVEERAQESFANDKRGGMIVVQKQAGANTVDIARKILKRLPELQKNLPSDVKLGIIWDSSENILQTIQSLTETVLFALLFVVLVIFLFLGRWRATLIISVAIPFSLIASFIYLAITGNSINIISLSSLSIAIGMVVDDAIVVLENVTTHIERGSAPNQAAVHGTNEVAISVVASTLTMIAVFFPLTMVTGMTGVLFKQLGWMMCTIMVVSTVAALTLTPMLCSRLLRLQKKPSKLFRTLYHPIQRVLDKLDVQYARMLGWAVRHRKTMVLSCVAFFALSMIFAGQIHSEFFPMQDNGYITTSFELPVGTRKEVARELGAKLSEEWRKKYPEIQVCSYSVGQADSDNTFASMRDNGSHILSFSISLSNAENRERSMAEIADDMREDLKAYPEFTKISIVPGGQNGGMGGQSTADFEIYGYDLATTDRIAAELKEKLLKVNGVSEVNISRGDYLPEYQVDFDREKLAMHGLNLSTAGTILRNRIYGSIASRYREDGDESNIVVRYAPEFRTNLDDIENILLYNNQGHAVRIRDVGTVVERFAPPAIERKDRERIVTVSAIPSGAALGTVVAEGKKIINGMEIPPNIKVQAAGTFEEQAEAFTDLGILAVIIILLVFIVMAAQFESLTYPFIIMFSVPFAVSGVLMALFLTRTTLSVMSLLGAIMLIGIVVKNGIVLIDYIILCRERGLSVITSVITSGKSRLRPVLMTTMTTILGMLPMAIGSGQGSEMWRPMGVAVIGGLTVSTLLTLLLVPVLYCSFAGVGIKRQRRKLRKTRESDAYYQEQKDRIIKTKQTR